MPETPSDPQEGRPPSDGADDTAARWRRVAGYGFDPKQHGSGDAGRNAEDGSSPESANTSRVETAALTPSDRPSGSGTRPSGSPTAAAGGAAPPPGQRGGGGDGGRGGGDGGGDGGSRDGDGFNRQYREQPGDEIGPYRLVGLIGRGGFGRVWRAERQKPFTQVVALKILRADEDREDILARFKQERQALALLNHPNIVKVLDGGITPNGLPYFTMELVKGETLVEYCDKHRLPLEARLRLFAQVCDAVEHAHMRGILHRDLKPNNILVTVNDREEPTPVVIDFGIAKAMTGLLTEDRVFTAKGEFVGTPEYMSPEQAEQSEAEIDRRSDIYSLGVILYELLVSEVPFSATTVEAVGVRARIAAIRKMLREQEAPRPSTKLSQLGKRSADVAAARQIRFEDLAGKLRGELEWIPLMALRKDRTQRYRTAADLAQDVRNWLDGRPLLAGPESAWYIARKFVRRNKGLVAATALVAASLVVGTTLALLSRAEAIEARDVAERRELQTRALLGFQLKQLTGVAQEQAGTALLGEIERQSSATIASRHADPAERAKAISDLKATLARINPTDVAYALVRDEVLRRSEQLAQADHASDPELQAGIFHVLGQAYLELGKSEPARGLLERAARIRTDRFGETDRRTLESRDWLLRAQVDASASKVLDDARNLLELRIRLFGEDDPDAIESRRTLAELLARAGSLKSAVAEYELAVAAGLRSAPDSLATIADLASLGDLLREAGDLDAGIERLMAARDRLSLLKDAPKRMRALVLQNLGLLQTARPELAERFTQGLANLEQANRLDEEIDGETHPRSFESRSSLAARMMDIEGREEDALKLHQRSLAIGEGLAARPNAYYIAVNNYTVWMRDMADPADPATYERTMRDALAMARGAYDIVASRVGANDDATLLLAKNVASLHAALGEHADAARILVPVIDARLSIRGPSDFKIQNLKCDLAEALAHQGRWSDAVAVLEDAQALATANLPFKSDGRWLTSCKLHSYLKQWAAADPSQKLDARIGSQDALLEALAAQRKSVNLGTDRGVESHLVRPQTDAR
ncbi:MAG: protein kinase domain-containing protein [Planctomycetota bacterium]